MNAKVVSDDYFEWLIARISKSEIQIKEDGDMSFRKLLDYLHHCEFKWSIPKDENRNIDGMELRYKFVRYFGFEELNITEYLPDGNASMLEMMVALAIRMEVDIAGDETYGDRTNQWFWHMIMSLGLGGQWGSNFDKDEVDECLERFYTHQIDDKGFGTLFRFKHDNYADKEIWWQVTHYLNSIATY